MEFKKINMGGMVLILIICFLILMTIFFNFKSNSADVPDNQIHETVLPPSVFNRPEIIEQHFNKVILSNKLIRPINNLNAVSEDEAMQKEMKDQMDRDRNQQRQIKILKMQLEQINLQLENEKASTEINKLKKENAEYIKGSSSQDGTGFPSIRVIYIGGTDSQKEAILSIDGTSYSVKEKDKPVSNVEILSVSDKSVKVHFSAPQNLITVINYVQE